MTANMQTAVQPSDFVTFSVSHRKSGTFTLVRVDLMQPVRLYDDSDVGYRHARGVARRRGRRELDLHPSAPVIIEPHDWSDGCEGLTEQAA